LIAVNQRVRLDVVLQAGAVAQQMEVTTTVPLLHVSDASLGEVIDQQQVSELPLNGRQFLELALLVPGAHTSHGAQMGVMSPLWWRPGQSSAIAISGGRPNANIYQLDGTVNTDPSFNTFVISHRGSLYEYLRNSKFDSPEFTNPRSPKRPPRPGRSSSWFGRPSKGAMPSPSHEQS